MENNNFGRKVFWGILLILIGVLFLLHNLDVISIHFNTNFQFWRYWPVLLIIGGAAAIFRGLTGKKVYWFGPSLALLFILLFVHIGPKEAHENETFFDFGDRDTKEMTKLSTNYDMDASIQKASLNIEAGMVDVVMNDSTSKLIDFEVNSTKGNAYTMTKVQAADSVSLNVKPEEDKEDIDEPINGKTNMKIGLNTKPLWDISIETGASKANLQLQQYKVRSLRVQTGASDIEMKITDNLPVSTVSIEAGASSITIYIPKTAEAQITTDNALTSTSFEGFTTQEGEDDTYVTPSYAKATKKINIHLESGAGSLKVKRY